MSTFSNQRSTRGRSSGATSRRGRIVAVVVAVLALALVGVGGSLLSPQAASYRQSPVPAVGRTSTVCPTAPAEGAKQTVTATAVRQAPGRAGQLDGTAIGADTAAITLSEQGRAVRVDAPKQPLVLTGEGVMASAASGTSYSTATTGELGGLMAATCAAPATQHWFVGVGASSSYRTELVLTNPDDGQAEVDLRFYGKAGLIVVPGSPGLRIDGHSSRTVALSSLLSYPDPMTVAVRASEGRVSATALNRASANLTPTGADWQAASAAPALQQVIPGVPEGSGSRRLVVTNPTQTRAEVTVSVLGIEGAYAPAGAESVEVAPESTAEVEVGAGLAGQPGSVQIASDQPVTAAVVSTSTRAESQPDIAVQPATAPIVRTGVVALATVDGADSELTLSNGGDTDVQLSFEVLSFEGVTLQNDDVLLVGHATATRRLTAPAPAYLVVTTQAAAQVYAGLTYTQQGGSVAGLATVQVSSPDLASRAPQTRFDPSVGRS